LLGLLVLKEAEPTGVLDCMFLDEGVDGMVLIELE
jgi:hypothetical protein